MSNPYETPRSPNPRSSPKTSRVSSLVILTFVVVLTFIFAGINAIGEELSAGFAICVTLIAGVSQLPGLFIAAWRRRTGTIAAIPLLIGAYLIALTACGVYSIYAFNGKADSVNSAAHLHVIFFPLMHCILAVAVYIVCGIASIVVQLTAKNRRREKVTE